MNDIRKYGIVSARVTTVTSSQSLTIQGNVRSYMIRNTGAIDAVVEVNGGGVPLASGEAQTFGGYDDSLRVDDLKITFAGAGVTRLIIVRDVLIKEPSYIEK